MKTSHLRVLAALTLAVAVSSFSGCLFGPDEDKEEKPVVEFKPLTDKENVIYNLVKSYNQANIEEYVKILHDDYTWVNQERDVVNLALPAYHTRAADSAMTARMFQAKLGTHPDPNMRINKLELTVYLASWQAISDLEGNPCEDCWETTRQYYLLIIMNDGDMTYIANDLVRLTVVPVMDGSKKLYKLRRAEDMPK